MYSYEDRIRAVELYITFGKRAAATVLQLGYPTTKALKRWHQEYEQRHDLPAGYVRSKPRYSAEQKAMVVSSIFRTFILGQHLGRLLVGVSVVAAGQDTWSGDGHDLG